MCVMYTYRSLCNFTFVLVVGDYCKMFINVYVLVYMWSCTYVCGTIPAYKIT